MYIKCVYVNITCTVTQLDVRIDYNLHGYTINMFLPTVTCMVTQKIMQVSTVTCTGT